MTRKRDERAETLEIDAPLATCGGCGFTTALDGTWSVEDGRLVFRAALSPLTRRGPDYESCSEGRHDNDGVLKFTRITVDDEPLDDGQMAALRSSARSREAFAEEMAGLARLLPGVMSAVVLADEMMRRVEERWGEDADEGPYCKQEIVNGVRDILGEFGAG